jgi:hypothetical protein
MNIPGVDAAKRELHEMAEAIERRCMAKLLKVTVYSAMEQLATLEPSAGWLDVLKDIERK